MTAAGYREVTYLLKHFGPENPDAAPLITA
jgi:hypothetical protein